MKRREGRRPALAVRPKARNVGSAALRRTLAPYLADLNLASEKRALVSYVRRGGKPENFMGSLDRLHLPDRWPIRTSR